MELNSDLIAVQGLMRTIEKSTGEFTKIKYKGGNENKISQVASGLKKLIDEKGYGNSSEQVRNIVMFLVLNTNFKNKIVADIKEYSHLVNIMPAFSDCLLFNVIVELDLMDAYGEVVQLLPLSLSHEMYNESIKSLSNRSPDIMLKNIYSINRAVIRKLSAVDLSTFKVRESVTELTDIATTLLLILSRFDPSSVTGWNKKKIYRHIGHTLLKLFDLMLLCPIEQETHANIVDQLISTTCTILNAVTLHVFCEWAEVTYQEESFQAVVSTEAYKVMEKYTKYNKGKQLVSMLATMARKPKSIQQQIIESSVELMIVKINENGPEQRQWFTALLNTTIFDNKASIECIAKWHHLCTIEDVNRLLIQSAHFKNPDINKLILKCAAGLSLEQLSLTITRYFCQHGINSNLQYENISEQIVMWFNKKGDSSEIDEGTNKRLQLLLFQNPHEFLSVVVRKLLEDAVLCCWIKPVFETLQIVFSKENLCLNVLKTAVDFNSNATRVDYKNSVLLIKMLLSCKCLDLNDLYYWLRESLGLAMKDDCEEGFQLGLNVILELKTKEFSIIHRTDLALFMLEILEKYRCSYIKFSTAHLEIAVSSIKILQKLEITVENLDCIPKLNQYYVKKNASSFLETVFPNFSIENYGDAIGKLIKELSRCVSDEWSMLSSDLHQKFSGEKTIELLTDTILLISQVTNTQQESENNAAFSSLKYYLSCYSVCLKKLQKKEKDLALEVCIVRNVVRVLKEIPEPLGFNEGILFLTIFTDRALKQLKDDKKFVLSLIDLHPEISKVMASRILN